LRPADDLPAVTLVRFIGLGLIDPAGRLNRSSKSRRPQPGCRGTARAGGSILPGMGMPQQECVGTRPAHRDLVADLESDLAASTQATSWVSR
jgi:hypothetical protein